MLCERLDKLAKEIVPGWCLASLMTSSMLRSEKIKYEVGKVDEEWTKICASIGIARTAVRTEEKIIMEDPMLTGAWLEMSEDTVQKILVLGVP